DLPLEVRQVDVRARRFQVLLRVAGHGDAELSELGPDERDQLVGVAQPAGDRAEVGFAAWRVAPQGHDVRDAALPGFAEIVAQLLDGRADAGEVRGHRQAELPPNAGDHVERL